jgi:hypothetical protein
VIAVKYGDKGPCNTYIQVSSLLKKKELSSIDEILKLEKGKKRRVPSSLIASYFVLRPVLLAAMLPTLRPGGAFLLTVDGLPGDW